MSFVLCTITQRQLHVIHLSSMQNLFTLQSTVVTPTRILSGNSNTIPNHVPYKYF